MTTEEFLPYLKCVGTGVKRNRDLDREEIQVAVEAMLLGKVSPEQSSAFLLGWRVKGESIDEFAGAIDIFDKMVKKSPIPNSVEFGYPYDGKVKNPYIITLIAKYLERYHINLSLHGDLLQPAKKGTTLKDAVTSLPLSNNIHFFDRKTYFKELHDFTTIRDKLGMRSSFNTIEKLLNITQSDTAIIGAFHKPFVDKYITLFKDRYKKLIIIRGNEGTPEIFSKCSIVIVENGETKEIKVDPKEYSIEYKKSTQRISKKESVELSKYPSEQLKMLAKLNAAVIIYLLNKSPSISSALERLKES